MFVCESSGISSSFLRRSLPSTRGAARDGSHKSTCLGMLKQAHTIGPTLCSQPSSGTPKKWGMVGACRYQSACLLAFFVLRFSLILKLDTQSWGVAGGLRHKYVISEVLRPGVRSVHLQSSVCEGGCLRLSGYVWS